MQTRGTIPNWEVKMLKHMCFAVGVALAAASPAQAVDFLVTGIGTPSGLDDQNSYTSELAGFGLTQLANNPGLSVSLTGPISINVFRSEEHTSELQSLMRTSYAVFCLKKK